MSGADAFTIGIEEEYLLVDARTLDLAEAPEAMIEECKRRLGDQVAPEFLRCQIEIGTKVCDTIGDARTDLGNLRRTIAEVAEGHGLTPISAGCHPAADWSDQTHRDRDRYNQLKKELGLISDRMLICGMHVHVGIGDDDTRIDLMNQASYFLPHMLALSASSPFWQGKDTGLASYRVGVFDNLPRTGLPPRFGSWSAYRRYVDTLIDAGLIEDATKVWWDLRPSANYPTLEARICDASPRIEQTLALAAVFQATLRMLWRLKTANKRWRVYDNCLIDENRWRARRFGCAEGLLDFGLGELVPVPRLVEEWIDLLAEDAEALDSVSDVASLRDTLARGTPADRQRRIFRQAVDGGATPQEAARAVTRDLADAFLDGVA